LYFLSIYSISDKRDLGELKKEWRGSSLDVILIYQLISREMITDKSKLVFYKKTRLKQLRIIHR